MGAEDGNLILPAKNETASTFQLGISMSSVFSHDGGDYARTEGVGYLVQHC